MTCAAEAKPLRRMRRSANQGGFMQAETKAPTQRGRFQIPWLMGFCAFLAIALYFLWDEHEAHIRGALPYALLLLCPLLHLFMHRREHTGSHPGDHRQPHEGALP
jgi:hypothetical protein